MTVYDRLSGYRVNGLVESSAQGTLLGSVGEMPDATLADGATVLYLGETTENYTNGTYYTSDGSSWSISVVSQSFNDLKAYAESIYADVCEINSFEIAVPSDGQLPDPGEEWTIYFVPSTNSQVENVYDEFIYVDGKWEQVGSTTFTLSIVQDSDGISINGTALQDATAEQDGLMTVAHVEAISANADAIKAETEARASADATLQTSIEANASDIDALEATAADLQTQITSNDSDIAALQESVEDNASAISSNATNISANASAIDELGTSLSAETEARTSADSALQASIDTNTSDISTLQATATDLQTQITGNDDDISALETTAADLQTQITGNDSDISTLQASVSANTSAISSNADAIATNASDIDALEATATSLQAQISSNDDDISSLQATATSLQTQITSNDDDISALQSSVSENTADIATNASGIGTLQTDLDSLGQVVSTLAAGAFTVSVVDALPTDGIVENCIYFVPNSGGGSNIYDEYLYVNSTWELIGTTEFNLDISQDSDGISVNSTSLQTATTARTGLMTAAQVTALATAESDIDALETSVATAQSTADTAVTNAATAQSTADTAVTNAATAQSTADTAVADAATAQSAAEGAQSTADTAVTNAATAQSTADTAVTNAATAQSAADAAQSTADANAASIASLESEISSISGGVSSVTGTSPISASLTDGEIAISHETSGVGTTYASSYLGSATAVPRLKIDSTGHITGVTTATIYPPTTAGTSGYVWTSDGSGAGAWSASTDASSGSYGSTTTVPIITVDSTGRITAISSSAMYPPTTAGTAYQYWRSDGSGRGVWQTADTEPTSGSSNLITSDAVYTAMSTPSLDATTVYASSTSLTASTVFSAVSTAASYSAVLSLSIETEAPGVLVITGVPRYYSSTYCYMYGGYWGDSNSSNKVAYVRFSSSAITVYHAGTGDSSWSSADASDTGCGSYCYTYYTIS